MPAKIEISQVKLMPAKIEMSSVKDELLVK